MEIKLGLETIDKQWLSCRISEGLNDRRIMEEEISLVQVDTIAEIIIQQLCKCEEPTELPAEI